jgi:hypothetical protein
MPSIFHYTDAAGLVGILSSKSLFATHYRCLNDSTEAAIIRNLIMPILESEVADVAPKLVKRGWLKRAFYEEYGANGHHLQAESIYRAITRTIDNVSPYFVLSFCKHSEESDPFEHGLLSQWRGYSNGGGVAIEFDEAGIDAIMNAENAQFIYGVSKTSDVLYGDFESLFKPERFKGLAGAMIAQLFGNRDASEVTGGKNIDEAIRDYILVAPFLKHAGFSEEREYRMVLAPVRKRHGDKGFKGEHKPIKFRIRNSSIVPYVELFETKEAALPIKSVIVGPHIDQEMQQEAVEMILEDAGIAAPVRTSQIPFRRW